MKYTLSRLQSDVMARLGEMVRPHSSSEIDIPWPEEVVGMKVESLLGEIGAKLISESPLESLGGAVDLPTDAVSAMRKMPCGLVGVDVKLPECFLRLVSVKMAGWKRSVSSAIAYGDPDWCRQFSFEPGIAGSPECPRAYLVSDGCGLLLRLSGSESADDSLEWLRFWTVPCVGDDGNFNFPESLYPLLVASIACHLTSS